MKRYAITGGTGTLGKALVEKLIESGIDQKAIWVFSRDENKQAKMGFIYPEINYIVGDVSDLDSVHNLVGRRKLYTVFHCAALKHVDRGEHNVGALKRVNIDGTINVLNECVRNKVDHFVFFSTDKAVLPINAYGFSKAFAEKYVQNMMRTSLANGFIDTNSSIYRWGNVIGSRGSVIETWVNLIKTGNDIALTDPRMTRFWITIEDAVNYVLETYWKTELDPRVCPAIKAAPLIEIITALEKIINKKVHVKTTGIRDGEKLHECLWTSHDYCITSNTSPQYTHDELVEKLSPIVYKILAEKR